MKKFNVLVVGGAGFIGSALCKELTKTCNMVVCLDNLIRGRLSNIEDLMLDKKFVFVQNDVNNRVIVDGLLKKYKIDYVFHLAANSDIQASSNKPQIEFENTAKTTWNILSSMRDNGVKNIFFASTSAVYGEPRNTPFKEDDLLCPVSYYGSAKMASEAFLHAFSHMNDFNVLIFRFPNVIGPNLTHGVFYDFINKLRKNPHHLSVLGNGTQCKPYMYVDDLISAITQLWWKNEGLNVYNVGVESSTNVKTIAEMIVKEMKLSNCVIEYGKSDIGWKGDVPKFSYCLKKIHSTGWKASLTSDEASLKTIKEALK